jgi:hypothetical protein
MGDTVEFWFSKQRILAAAKRLWLSSVTAGPSGL